MSAFTTCQKCNRLIRVEHGPVCVFCREPEPTKPKKDDKEPSA